MDLLCVATIIRPCPNSIDCPGFDSPFANYSSEAPDPPDFLSDGFFGDSGYPPIHNEWTATSCGVTYTSTISQLDADLQAIINAYKCFHEVTGQNPTCCNDEQCCTLQTPEGEVVYCVPAGSFCAPTCEEANQYAQSVACYFSKKVNGGMNRGAFRACVSQPFAATVTLSGTFSTSSTVFFWFLFSGSLPPGVVFVDGFYGTTAVVSGTPTTPGNYTFTLRATNPSGISIQRTYTICVSEIDPNILDDGTVGTDYSQFVSLNPASSCLGAHTWQVISGALPDGLTLNSSTGEISGTPTKDGDFDFTIGLIA